MHLIESIGWAGWPGCTGLSAENGPAGSEPLRPFTGSHLVAALLIAAGALACSSTRPVTEADRSMSVEHSPSDALATTRAMLESRGYDIAAFRPDSGLVRTRYRRDDDLIGAGKEARMRVIGRVHEDGEGSRIVLEFSGQMRMGGDESWSTMPFSENDRTIYQNYLSQIRQMLP